MAEAVVSEEVKAAKGGEANKRVVERVKSWIREKHVSIPKEDRHAFETVKKKALQGQSERSVASRVQAALETKAQASRAEGKAIRTRIWMKTAGIAASIAAFIDPEPISKTALAATALGIGVAEKTDDIKKMKALRNERPGMLPPDAQGRVVERMMQRGGAVAR